MLRPHARSSAAPDPSPVPAGPADVPGGRDRTPVDGPVLEVRGGQVVVERASGGLASASVPAPRAGGIEFLAGTGGRGLVRIAAPLPDYPSHYVELGTHGAPEITEVPDGLLLVHEGLSTPHADLDVRVEVELRSSPEGLVLRCRVENRSDLRLPAGGLPAAARPAAGRWRRRDPGADEPREPCTRCGT